MSVIVNKTERKVSVTVKKAADGKDFKYEDFTPEQLEALKLKFEDLSPDDKAGLALKFEDLTPEQIASLKGEKGDTGEVIFAGESGKMYDSLAEAQAVTPKPANGTVFQVSKLDSGNAGVYTFQSGEVGGVRFERVLISEDTLHNVIDFPRTILSSSDLLTGKKVRVLTGAYVTDVNWRYVDLFPVELGQYSVTGWFDTVYSVAAYDHEGGYIEGYPAPVTGSQTYTFTISNPNVKKLRVSSHSAGAAAFQFKKLNESIARKELRGELEIPDLKLKTVYVAKTGNDTNSGSKNFPFLTISAAINYVKNDGGTIVVKEGDYYETLNLKDVVSELKIINYDFEKVRVMGSEVISGITKTVGRNIIYEAPFSGEILLTGGATAYGYRIFEDGVASKLIPATERNALQRSQSHRLPFSEIKQITDQGSLTANLDYLDALSLGESGYWKDEVNSMIYIVNSSQTQPLSIHYPVRSGTDSIVSNGITDKLTTDVSIEGLQFFYSKEIGLELYRFNKVKIHQVSVFGSRLTGFNEQASRSEVNLLECGGCGTDGLASSLYFPPPSDLDRNNEVWNTYRNIWCHDNYDDGFSVHQNGSVNIDGFLFEYNGDTGLQNVGCSYSFLQNGFSRNNTKGIVINGGGTASHSRASTSLEGYNITSENNNWNFESVGDENTTPAVMNLYNCVSRNGTNGYEVSGSNAVLKAYNCKSTGDTNPNNGATVINDADLI